MKQLVLFALVLGLSVACNGLIPNTEDDVPTKTLIETGLATDVTAFTATLSGYANPGPELGEVTMGIVYSKEANPSLDNGTEATSKELDGENRFFVKVNKLSPNTTYYYKSFIEYGDVYRCGEVKSFTTLEYTVEVETCPATDVGYTTAVINGRLKNVEGIEDFTKQVYFIIGSRHIGAALQADGSFYAVCPDLRANEDYAYKACAKVLGQEVFGEEQLFRTLGPEEGESEYSVIGRIIGENWQRDFVMAKEGDVYVLRNLQLQSEDEFKIRKDKDWGINLGGDFTKVDKAFSVYGDGPNVRPKLYGMFDIYLKPDYFLMAVCLSGHLPDWDYVDDNGEGGGNENPQENYQAPITIDGEFGDWDYLDPSTISSAYSHPDAGRVALKMVKVYADQQFIYVYFEWDTEMIQFSEENNEWVPFQCFVNSDGDVSTGGYSDDFSDACSDILLEGYLLWPYDPAVYPWVSGPNRSGWLWGDPLIDVGYGLGQGAGVIEEGKYEFLINRSMLSQCGYPIADVFSIGFEILQYWDPVGVLPNAPVTIDNPKGLAPSLQVVTFN